MYFKVFDKDGKDITNDRSWVITQTGRILYRDYDDLTGMEGVKAVLILTTDILKLLLVLGMKRGCNMFYANLLFTCGLTTDSA